MKKLGLAIAILSACHLAHADTATTQIGQAGLGIHDNATSRLHALDTHTELLNRQKRGTDKNIWANVNAYQNQSIGSDKEFSPNVMIGVDLNNFINPNSVSGAYVGAGKQTSDFGQFGEFKTNHVGLGVYHKQFFNQGFNLTAHAGIDRLDADSLRRTDTTSLNASTEGMQYHAGLKVGKLYRLYNFSVNPYFGLTAIKTDLDGFGETGTDAHTFSRQKYSHLNSELGVTGRFVMRRDLAVFGQASYTHRLGGDDHHTLSVNNGTTLTTGTYGGRTTNGFNVAIGVQKQIIGYDTVFALTHGTADNIGTGAFVQIGQKF